MRQDDMEEEILHYLDLRRRKVVTFSDLDRDLPGFSSIQVTLKNRLYHPGFRNVVLWPYASDEAREVMTRLIRGRIVRVKSCDKKIYGKWAQVIPLPIALPYSAYASARWLPSVVSLPKGFHVYRTPR